MINPRKHYISKGKKLSLTCSSIILLIILLFVAFQHKEPWTAKQMMAPSLLNQKLRSPSSEQPLIISIGPQAVIKNSLDIGPGQNEENLEKLKSKLEKVSREEEIVIYCGCCPLTKCPNIRPAFKLLNEMGFKRHKLLALLTNIKVDWIDKNYPVSE